MHLQVLEGYLGEEDIASAAGNTWDLFTKVMPAEQLWQIVRKFWHGAMIMDAAEDGPVKEFMDADFATV